MSEMDTFWFRPKRYGYGAEPTGWRGWVATGVFLLGVAVVAWFGFISPAIGGQELSAEAAVLVWSILVAMTAYFIWLCRRKTDGPWRWRWGKTD